MRNLLRGSLRTVGDSGTGPDTCLKSPGAANRAAEAPPALEPARGKADGLAETASNSLAYTPLALVSNPFTATCYDLNAEAEAGAAEVEAWDLEATAEVAMEALAAAAWVSVPRPRQAAGGLHRTTLEAPAASPRVRLESAAGKLCYPGCSRCHGR